MYQDIFSYTCTYRYILFTKIRTRTYWYVQVQVYRGISWYITVQSGISLYIDIQSGTNTYIPVHTSLSKVHRCTYWYRLFCFLLHPPGWPARVLNICCCHCSVTRHTSSSTMVFTFLVLLPPPGHPLSWEGGVLAGAVMGWSAARPALPLHMLDPPTCCHPCDVTMM